MNNIFRRALQSSGTPCLLEPSGLDRGVGESPDGVTMYAFEHGKSLFWDFTCVDAYAFTHVNQSAVRQGQRLMRRKR